MITYMHAYSLDEVQCTMNNVQFLLVGVPVNLHMRAEFSALINNLLSGYERVSQKL